MAYQPPALSITSLKLGGRRYELGGVSITEAVDALQRFAAVDITSLKHVEAEMMDVTTHSMLTARHARRFERIDRLCSYCFTIRREVLRVDRCEGCGACDWKETE